MGKGQKPTFKLTLVAEPRPDGSDADGMRRLRGILKGLLRGFRFRCLNIERPPELASGDDARPLRPTQGEEVEST